MPHSTKPQIVVIGGGFAGMASVRALRSSEAEIKLVDRRSFYLFQPLLYQVATGGLSPANIAAPLRSIFKKQKNVQVLLAGVDGFDVVSHAGESKRLDTYTVPWAAGVKASSLGKKLAEAIGPTVQLDRGGRVAVDSQCAVAGYSNVFVVGDLAAFRLADGTTLLGVAPVAMQQGAYLGNLIAKTVKGSRPTGPFKYWDKGNIATIGRSRAIVEIGQWRMTGQLAWLAWLFIHILYLARFENRMLVLFQWSWSYLTRNRTARLITGKTQEAR